MTYQEAIQYLYSQLPMFQRQGEIAFNYKLDKTLAICRRLGNPQNKFEAIHIAGTNGKGSVSHFTASVLQSAGMKVGLYTSPHLKDFKERIRINGQKISQSYVVDFVERGKKLLKDIQPSFFEYSFGMAISYFAENNIDIAVIETGMGGRLDSTNVVRPAVSVITNISYDHTQYLGNTLEKIAIEKAGIIKPLIPLVIGETQTDILPVLIGVAQKHRVEVYIADQKFSLTDNMTFSKKTVYDIQKDKINYLKNVSSGLNADYQKKNLLTTFQIIDILRESGMSIPDNAIRHGIENVKDLTGIMGRWQKLGEDPLVYCDTGHNQEGIRNVISELNKLSYQKLHFVFGAVNDKDLVPVMSLLPKKAIYYFCKADIPRGLETESLKNIAEKFDLKGESYRSVNEAFKTAKLAATKNDLVFVGGSTFIVAEIL